MFKSASTCDECREVGEGGRLGSLVGGGSFCRRCRGAGGGEGGHETEGDGEREECSHSSSTNCRFVLMLSWSSTSELWSEQSDPGGELGALCEHVSLK